MYFTNNNEHLFFINFHLINFILTLFIIQYNQSSINKKTIHKRYFVLFYFILIQKLTKIISVISIILWALCCWTLWKPPLSSVLSTRSAFPTSRIFLFSFGCSLDGSSTRSYNVMTSHPTLPLLQESIFFATSRSIPTTMDDLEQSHILMSSSTFPTPNTFCSPHCSIRPQNFRIFFGMSQSSSWIPLESQIFIVLYCTNIGNTFLLFIYDLSSKRMVNGIQDHWSFSTSIHANIHRILSPNPWVW